MFNDAPVNKTTKSRLENFLKRPSHAILLVGQPGSDSMALVEILATELLGINLGKLQDYPHFLVIEKPPEKKEIPVELIRKLTKDLSLTIPGSDGIKRVVVIKDANLMNPEAQNALLKSLEEPPKNTVFILAANSKNGILPTVISRSTVVVVYGLTLDEAYSYFSGYDKTQVASAWALSQGSPQLLSSLLSEPDNDFRKAVEQAKELLRKDKYYQLVELDAISKDKTKLLEVLEALARVFKALYRGAAERQDKRQALKLATAAKLVLSAQKDIQLNVQPRLVILKLVLNLPI